MDLCTVYVYIWYVYDMYIYVIYVLILLIGCSLKAYVRSEKCWAYMQLKGSTRTLTFTRSLTRTVPVWYILLMYFWILDLFFNPYGFGFYGLRLRIARREFAEKSWSFHEIWQRHNFINIKFSIILYNFYLWIHHISVTISIWK